MKGVGYVLSIISVLLLGAAAWKGASAQPLTLACLVAGMAISIVGMALRWASHAREQRDKARGG